RSIDYNSLSSQGVVVQDSYDVSNDRGLSDFDARHRVVMTATYDLPFKQNRFARGWQIALIIQAQSGNPINIVSSNSTVNGVPNTLRPNVNGSVNIVGTVEKWFDTSAFIPTNGFGNLGRNVVTGPAFSNTDASIARHFRINDRLSAQFRFECFDLFNHANLGQPGNVTASANFGRITATRFPTGESGSSRQLQFALKLSF